MIKLIASDMDGTLLNDDHMISDENLRAIRKAQEMGRHFTIAIFISSICAFKKAILYGS